MKGNLFAVLLYKEIFLANNKMRGEITLRKIYLETIKNRQLKKP
jgi:hypothetical protein